MRSTVVALALLALPALADVRVSREYVTPDGVEVFVLSPTPGGVAVDVELAGLLRLPVVLGAVELDAVGVEAGGTPTLPTPVVPGFDADSPLNSLITTGAALAASGQWLALGLLLLFAAVFGLRALSSRLPEGGVKAALTSRWGGWGLNLATALAGSFAALAAAGGPWTVVTVVGAIVGAVTLSLGGGGLVALMSDVKARDEKASAAGEAAAAAVTDKAKAINALKG